MRGEPVKVRPEALDEQERRALDYLLIPLLVLGEPTPVVVALKLAQEIE